MQNTSLLSCLTALVLAFLPLVSAISGAELSVSVTTLVTSTESATPSIIHHPDDPCNPGSRRCAGEFLQICNTTGLWATVKCSANLPCNPKNAHCSPSAEVQCRANTKRCNGNTVEYCVRGHWFADEVCGKNQICSTASTPDMAECHKASPAIARDVAQECEPKSSACDSERRFLFHCDAYGRWKKPRQCFNAGYCRVEGEKGLLCGGWPKFKEDDGICNGRCESLHYLYCAGGSENPAKWEDCRRRMCNNDFCKGCDRCHYQMPYGGVEPDLSTVYLNNPGNWQ